ncbi:hypothetical protein [Kitasatospora sp. NPDC058190]|uniref:hypothetical protein n=1 Tax=Kitasatospora sp. NPDC058190 TaxID=3346371 RepID=UPI0036DA6ACA
MSHCRAEGERLLHEAERSGLLDAARDWYTAGLRQYENLGGTRDTGRLQRRITALAET